METTITETIEVLNDLTAINNDRIRGYERAIEETMPADSDLRILFTNMISESHNIRVDLASQVKEMGGEFEAGTTLSGKLYRAWMDVRAVFTGHDRYTVLANCEAGEDAAQKAYKDALDTDDLPPNIRTILEKQKQALRASHNKVKALRDLAK
jgi:uncharacterized protein (TIGR02284 family)